MSETLQQRHPCTFRRCPVGRSSADPAVYTPSRSATAGSAMATNFSGSDKGPSLPSADARGLTPGVKRPKADLWRPMPSTQLPCRLLVETEQVRDRCAFVYTGVWPEADRKTPALGGPRLRRLPPVGVRATQQVVGQPGRRRRLSRCRRVDGLVCERGATHLPPGRRTRCKDRRAVVGPRLNCTGTTAPDLTRALTVGAK